MSDRKTTKLSALGHFGWLANEPVDFRQWVEREGRWRRFSAEQIVYQAGEPPDGVYGLGSGSLLVTFPLIAEEPVVIHRAEPGFWIGDLAELSEARRLVTVSAAADCRLFHLPSHAIHATLAVRPDFWRSFYRLNLINLTTTIRLLSETLALTVRARVCRRLQSLSEHSSSIDITQEQLAQLLGVTRTTMRRCLADLEARGAIQATYRKLEVKDRAILESFKDEQ